VDRVAFLVEDSKERLGCMLNPETLELRRRAGLAQRDAGRAGTGATGDDALLATGGGLTELRLDLLFDVQLAGSSIASTDVRDLTGPLWRLAENRTAGPGHGRVPRVRFIWGKHWNIPGVVAAVAERLDRFSSAGAPQRSWLRLRLLRVEDASTPPVAQAPPVLPDPESPPPGPAISSPLPAAAAMHVVLGAGDGDGRGSERLDAIAQRMYGDPTVWRTLAAANRIDDPLRLPTGLQLHLPAAGGGR
jgi:hypothetical protein